MTSTEILAPGIVKFKSCFAIDDAQLERLHSKTQQAFEDSYKFVYDDAGELLYGINHSYHKVPVEYLSKIHVTIGSGLDRSLTDLLEKAIYQSLLEYIAIYPDALRSVWWRTVGHVAAYPTGTFLSAHSDNDVNYRPGTTPKDQAAVQHAVSCSALLNDNFQGGNFLFEYYDINVQLKAGDILLFPSNFLGAHEVTEITSGTRYSYVSWFGQGSADETKNIRPQHRADASNAPGQVWMDHLYEDFKSLAGAEAGSARRVLERVSDHEEH